MKKKIATLAFAVALTATSLSAGTWWSVPCITQEQQQAMAQQQINVRERMMAAQRWQAKQIAARQAEMAKRLRTQGVDPVTRGFPGTMDPLGTPPISMDPWDAADPWGDIGMPEYPNIPAMPEPFSMHRPQPPIPSFMRDRYAELEAYRARMMEESKARRDEKTKEIAKRRKEFEANRFTHPRHYGRPFQPPYPKMTMTPEMSASTPQATPAVKTPTQPSGTTPTSKTTPTATTTTQGPVTPAVPVTPIPAPAAPAPTAAPPQDY